MPKVKNIGKPCKGEPHAFDEGGLGVPALYSTPRFTCLCEDSRSPKVIILKECPKVSPQRFPNIYEKVSE